MKTPLVSLILPVDIAQQLRKALSGVALHHRPHDQLHLSQRCPTCGRGVRNRKGRGRPPKFCVQCSATRRRYRRIHRTPTSLTA